MAATQELKVKLNVDTEGYAAIDKSLDNTIEKQKEIVDLSIELVKVNDNIKLLEGEKLAATEKLTATIQKLNDNERLNAALAENAAKAAIRSYNERIKATNELLDKEKTILAVLQDTAKAYEKINLTDITPRKPPALTAGLTDPNAAPTTIAGSPSAYNPFSMGTNFEKSKAAAEAAIADYYENQTVLAAMAAKKEKEFQELMVWYAERAAEDKARAEREYVKQYEQLLEEQERALKASEERKLAIIKQYEEAAAAVENMRNRQAKEASDYRAFLEQADANRQKIVKASTEAMYAELFKSTLDKADLMDDVQKAVDKANYIAEKSRLVKEKLASSATTSAVPEKQQEHTEVIDKNTAALHANAKGLEVVSTRHKSLVGHIAEVISIYGVLNTTVNLVQEALLKIPKSGIEFQATQASVYSVFGSEAGAKDLKYLVDLADNAGQNLKALETAYRSFAPSAMLAGASQEDVNQVFRNFTEVGTVLHLPEEKIKSVYLALEQMYAKTTVQSEELKKQLGNVLPGAVEIGAKAMEKTPQAFMKAMANNEIIAKEFVPKFATLYRKIFGGENDEVFNSTRDKLFSNLNRIVNQYELFSRELFNTTEDTMNSVVRVAGDLLKTLANNARAATQVVAAFGLLAGTATIGGIAKLSTELVAVKDHTGAITEEITKGELWLRKFGSTGRAIFNPLTIAVGATAAAFAGLITSVENSDFAYGKFTGTSDKVVAKLQEVYLAQGEGADEAGRKLQELAKLQDKSNSLYIEYGEQQVRVTTILQVMWDRVATTVKDTWATIKNTLISFDDWFTNTFNFSISKTLEDLNNKIKQLGVEYQKGLGGIIYAVSNMHINLDDNNANKDLSVQKRITRGLKAIKEAFAKGIADYEEYGRTLDEKATKEGSSPGSRTALSVLEEAAKREKEIAQQKLKTMLDVPNQDFGNNLENNVEKTKKQYNDMYKALARDSENYSETVKASLVEVADSYARNLTSIKGYFESKLTLEKEDLNHQIENARKALEIAQTSGDEGKIEQYKDNIEKLQNKLNTLQASVTKEETAALTAYETKLKEVEATYLEFIGKTAEASSIRFDAQNAALMQRLKTESEATNTNTEAEREKAASALKWMQISKANSILVGQVKEIDEQRTKINDEYNASINKTNILVQTGAIGQYTAWVQQTEFNDKRIAQLEKLIEKEQEQIDLAKQSGAVDPKEIDKLKKLRDELDNFKLTSDVVATHFEEVFTRSFSEAFTGFATGTKTAKEAFTSLVSSMIGELQKLIAQEAASQLLKGMIKPAIGSFSGDTGLLGSLGSLFGSSASAGSAGGLGSFLSSAGSFIGLANGGVMQGNGISAHSGTIVDKPTVFPFAKGIGLMGEAGAEAILPLQRNKAGKLGVSVENSGQQAGNVYNVSITVQSNGKEQPSDLGAKIGEAFIRTIAKDEIANAARPGNILNKTTNFG